MNWKANIQVRDLDADQRLEATCKVCGHVHYLTRATLMNSPEREFLFIDEVEREAMCKARGCRGPVRIALVRKGDTSGFVGGMA